MDTSLVVAGAAVGGNILLGIGLAASWIRNGRSASKKYGAVETELKNTGKKVDALTLTVDGIDGKLDKFQNHCSDTVGRFDERIIAAERDIRDAKKDIKANQA